MQRKLPSALSQSGSQALGALALGAFAVGALAIGRLVLKRLSPGHARARSVEIDRLDVKELRVGDLEITGRLIAPEGAAGRV